MVLVAASVSGACAVAGVPGVIVVMIILLVCSSQSLFSATKWNAPHLSRDDMHSNCALLYRSFNHAGYRMRATDDTTSDGTMVILMLIGGVFALH